MHVYAGDHDDALPNNMGPAGIKKTVAAKRKPSPAVDPTIGDNVDGEDLDIRRAAVDALGQYNGSVVVVDPNTGRILTMVNQKVALSSGFQPCSTVKVSVATRFPP